MTVGAWYDSQELSPVARMLLEICTVGILSVPTVEVSLLDLLFNVQVCGVSAELLAAAGARVRLVTPLLVVAPYLDRTLEGQPVRERLAKLGCELELEPDTELESIGRDSCILRR